MRLAVKIADMGVREMRKILFAAVALSIVSSLVLPFEAFAGGARVGEADAMMAAQEAFIERTGLHPDEARKYDMRAEYNKFDGAPGGDIWVVTFEYQTPYDLGFMYFGVDVSAEDATVSDTGDPAAFMAFMRQFMLWEEQADRQEALEREKGPYRDWTDDEKASLPIDPANLDFAKAQHLPLPEDMQLWEAVELARAALGDEYRLNEDDLEGLDINGNFYGQERPKAWSIGLEGGSGEKYAVVITSPDGSIELVERY
jgi:hypothetical protein